MNPDRWKQIDELFDAVLEIPENERKDFLSKKTNGDDELEKEILSLLKAQHSADKFMEKSAMNVMAKEIANQESTIFDNSFLNKTIGNYQVKRPIGAGGMGEVYLARDTKLNRMVALKILPKEFVADPERIKRFEIEASAVSALNHPNIVTVYDVGKFDEVNYIATEYVEGETVRELIGQKLKLKDILPIIIQTCEALSAAHNAGIIHRDIKPENIMVRPDGYVKVLDFGLAKLSGGEINKTDFAGTMKGVVIGTPAYMSPNQISDEKVDHRTDLWSIGVVLYEMLTGKNPFKAENRQATFQAILSEDPPLASTLNLQITPDLDQILVKVLEKDADLSYQTASDLRADLKRVKREIDSSPTWNSRSAKVQAQKRETLVKRQNFFLYAIGLIILTAIGFGAWFIISNRKPKEIVKGIDWSKAKTIQATDTLPVESYPSLSPDGKTLVFSMDSEEYQNIYSQRVGGKNITNLTADSKSNNTMPAYSPDGKLIAFRSERKPSGIYVMEETAENVRPVSDMGFHPSWSPDGKKIVVSERASIHHSLHTVPNSSLWTIDISNGQKKQLETKGDAIMPSWSPNGQRIAFWFVKPGKLGEIATIPADGGEPVVITEDSFSDWNPVWSPDGKFLYFASDRGGNMSLWRIAIDESTGKPLGEPESVGTTSKYCRHITFSRNGNLIAYIRYESKSNLQTLGFDPKTKRPVGEINWVTRGNHEITNPSLSPNGEEYVVRNPKPSQEDLVIFNKDGANWRNLTNDTFLKRIPSWSHDGSKILFHSDRSGKYQIWTINPDGSNLKQITFSEKTGAYIGVFSPDDSRLAFTEIDDKAQRSFIMDMTKPWNEQTPQPIKLDGINLSWVVDWSPDGNKLLMLLFDSAGNVNNIVVYDLQTSTYKEMTDSGSSPFWLNDSRYFIFNNLKSIYLCDSETKKIVEIYKPSVYEIQNVNITADNKMLYFRYLQVDADIWLLDAGNDQ